MKSVFLVEYGYKYEGGEIDIIHKTKAGALEKVHSVIKALNSDQWVEEGGEGCSRLWIDNYKYVEIREMKVEK